MAIFGSLRDINTFKSISRELVDDVISQQCGYYKVVLPDTAPNLYGEATTKTYVGPFLLNCMIERGEFTAPTDDFGPDIQQKSVFRILKDDMIALNLYPEVGDVIMYNELYYEVDNIDRRKQLILGKDNEYAYSEGLENFGDDYAVILETHYTRGDKLGITQQRL